MDNKRKNSIKNVILITLFLLTLILAIYSIKNNYDLALKYLSFIFAPILIISLLVLVTLIIYFVIDKKSKSTHLNFWFIVSLFWIVFLIHSICVFTVGLNSDNKNIVDLNYWQIIQKGFEEIYSQLGGLGFEGQEFNSASVAGSIIYFCSIAWLAITNAIIITIGLNYRFYSYICVYITKFKFRSKRKYFIFTSANETSFEFARNLLDSKNDEIYEIIFCSDELEPFDKENQLHKQIHEMDFYYCPIKKVSDNSKKKSILGKLFHIKNSNEIIEFLNKNKVYIFALAKDYTNKGDESLNSDIIFDDMELELNLIRHNDGKNINYDELKVICEPKSKDDNAILINYYVLSHNDINFDFYSEKLNDIFRDSFNDCKEKVENEIFMHCGLPFFNLKILNEAIMSSDDLIDQRLNNLDKDNCINEYLINCNKDESDNLTSIVDNPIDTSIKMQDDKIEPKFDHLVIGFGETGQAALGSLMLLETGGCLYNENLELISKPFNALVVDKNINNQIIGNFKIKHPLFCVGNCEFDKDSNYKETYETGINAYFPSKSSEITEKKYQKFKEFNKFFNLPLIFYSSINYESIDFNNKILKQMCNETNKSILIALGNDEDNIKCANSILKFIHQSRKYLNTKEIFNFRIYVNIKNYNNNKRINIEKLDEDKKIFLYTFGNYKNIYSNNLFNSKLESSVYYLYDKYKNKDKAKNKHEYFYLTQNTILNKKINETSYKFLKLYELYLNSSSNIIDNVSSIHKDYKDEKEKIKIKKNENKIQELENYINNDKNTFSFEESKIILLSLVSNIDAVSKLNEIFNIYKDNSCDELEDHLFCFHFKNEVTRQNGSKPKNEFLVYVIDNKSKNKTNLIKSNYSKMLKKFNKIKDILNNTNDDKININEVKDILKKDDKRVDFLIPALLSKYKDENNKINISNIEKILLKIFIRNNDFYDLTQALLYYLIDNSYIEYKEKEINSDFLDFVFNYLKFDKNSTNDDFNIKDGKKLIELIKKVNITIKHKNNLYTKQDLKIELLENMVDQNKIDFLYDKLKKKEINDFKKDDLEKILKTYLSEFQLVYAKDAKLLNSNEDPIKYTDVVIKNIKEIYKNNFTSYYNFSNYLRLQRKNDNNFYKKKGEEIKVDYILHYLVQIENSIIGKLRMIYGFTNVKSYQEEIKNDSKLRHFYKDYLKCHNKIHPFDKFTTFEDKADSKKNKKVENPYLFYKYEDDLYISIIYLLLHKEN